MQALELEEFRALERQITQDSGSVRGSVVSLSSASAWQSHTGAATLQSSKGLQQWRQQHAVHKLARPQSVRSQLSETNDLLLEHVQGARQAVKQRPPPRVTGNPFADPEQSPSIDPENHPAPAASQQDPFTDMEHSDSHAPAGLPQLSYADQQQSYQFANLGGESAWDAVSAPTASADTSSAQEVRRLFSRC